MKTTTDKGWSLLDRIGEAMDEGGDLLEEMWGIVDTYDKYGELFAVMMAYYEHHEASDEMFGLLVEMVRGYLKDRSETEKGGEANG